MYVCKTCNEHPSNNDDNTVCEACKMFCHKGHTLVPASQNLYIKSLCDCGRGGFGNCDRFNEENPIPELKAVGQRCSVTHPTFQMILEES